MKTKISKMAVAGILTLALAMGANSKALAGTSAGLVSPVVGGQVVTGKWKASGKTLMNIKMSLCREDKNGICAPLTNLMLESFSGATEPFEAVQEIQYLAQVVPMGIDSEGEPLYIDIPNIVTVGLKGNIYPVFDGKFSVGYTINLSALKEIKTSNKVQVPVLDHLLAASGVIDLASGGTKSVQIGNGYRLTLSATLPKT